MAFRGEGNDAIDAAHSVLHVLPMTRGIYHAFTELPGEIESPLRILFSRRIVPTKGTVHNTEDYPLKSISDTHAFHTI